jgi:uncharacterized protein YjiS (DUF1127 family)
MYGCYATSANYTIAQRNNAVAEVKFFHKMYNENRFAEIYQTGSWYFRDTFTEEEFVRLMESRRQRWGKVVSTENQGYLIDTMARYDPDFLQYNWRESNRTIVELLQMTEFEYSRSAETFAFMSPILAGRPRRPLGLFSYEPVTLSPAPETGSPEKDWQLVDQKGHSHAQATPPPLSPREDSSEY